ncbi:MAG: hypothetical protein QW275_03475, partial [Candidatus Anstonellaceae archaeon]
VLLLLLISGCAAPNEPPKTMPSLDEETKAQPLPVPQASTLGKAENFSPPLGSPEEEVLGGKEKQNIYYFYSPLCPYCNRISSLIHDTESRFQNFAWRKHNVDSKEGYLEFERVANEKNLSKASRAVPLVVVENFTLIGEQEIRSSLGSLLYNLSQNYSGTPK